MAARYKFLSTAFNLLSSPGDPDPDAPKYEPLKWYFRDPEAAAQLWTDNVDKLVEISAISDTEKEFSKDNFVKAFSSSNLLYYLVTEEDERLAVILSQLFYNLEEGPWKRSNCFGYSVQDGCGPLLDDSLQSMAFIPHPGEAAEKYGVGANPKITPAEITAHLEADGIIKTTPEEAFAGDRDGYYCIAAFLSYNEDDTLDDFHFARQNNDGTWSCQWAIQGDIGLLEDDKGDPLEDPRDWANTRYKFLSFFRVPASGLNVGVDAPAPGQAPPCKI